MKTESEKSVEKIFTELYEGYEKGKNWDNALDKVNNIIKNMQEGFTKKLNSDRRKLISEVESTKKEAVKIRKELSVLKKNKIPNLQREIIRLQQIINKNNGSL